MILTKLFSEFFESKKAGGIVLLICTAVSLFIANSAYGEGYFHLLHLDVGGYSLTHWINDGLMSIFFLLIGLELEREIYIGELSGFREALLPAFGALGGMVFPAGVYLAFNYGLPTQSGAGIPMATDIAFALGILALLGRRVSLPLKVFLTALAVIDDLGAIIIIAIFYTKALVLTNLFIALGIFGLLIVLNRLKVHNLIPYLIGGVGMWYFMHNSGVHATITGVLLAFAVPFGNGDERSTSYILQNFLHKPVAFVILPLFAMANTAVHIAPNLGNIFLESYSLGIAGGLIVGKPIGIFLMVLLAVKLKLCQLSSEISLKQVFGVGLLAGIGFTMSIFITLLAFEDETIVRNTKLVVLVASLVAGLLGFLALRVSLPPLAMVERTE